MLYYLLLGIWYLIEMMKKTELNSTSKYYGVTYRKDRGKFRSLIKVDNVNIALGVYIDEIEAAKAYDSAVKYYGLDRKLNFPEPEPENLIPNTRLIRLNKGYFAVVDEDMYEEINSHEWTAVEHFNTVYAVCSEFAFKDGYSKFMHRNILNVAVDKMIDHKNGNGLHNYRSNLRECSNSENQHNQKPKRCGSSLFKGVSKSKDNKYRAQIKLNNKSKYIGSFKSELEAAKAYDAKAKELFGEFARLNFPSYN